MSALRRALLECVALVADPDRLRRSLLFVPGAEPRKIEGARGAGAGTLIFDLEDAVAVERKDVARQQVVEFLRAGGFGEAELSVRVNAPGTPFFAEDVAAVVAAGVHAVVLPKAETMDGVRQAEQAMAAAEWSAGRSAGSIPILALVESALGIARARALCGATARVQALCFGHVDFSLDMDLPDADAGGGVVLHAHCALAIGARAGRVAPIDCVCLAVRDEAALRTDADLGRRLGFEGKLCIHPAQFGVVNAVHTPSVEQVAYAQRVVAAWEEARAAGHGVLAVDGRMIDTPVVAAQQRLLARARRAGVLGG